MSTRTNHPLKTLFLLGLVALVGWAGYEYIYVQGIFRGEPTVADIAATRSSVRQAIFEAYKTDSCLVDIDEISYRAKEHHYRIRITVSYECSDDARKICEEIARIASDIADESAGVFAYDRAGNPLAKFIQ